MAQNEYVVTLVVDSSGAVTGLRNARGEAVDLGKAFGRAEGQAERFSGVMQVALGTLAGGLLEQATASILAIPGLMMQAGRALESQLADLSAITGIAGRDLERLGQTAVAESVRTGVAATDQVEAFKLLASNIDIATVGGVKGLERLGRETVTLAQAAKVDLSVAANVVAGTMNQFKLSGNESARVVNALAAGAKFGAAEVADLGEAMKNAGTGARLAGVSVEGTIGALEVLSQSSIKGAEAGTGLRNVMGLLQTKTEELAAVGITGVNLKADGLSRTLAKLQPILGNASAMTDVFGQENINVASILIQNAEAVEEMTGKVTGTNVAYEQAAVQMATFDGAVLRLQAAVVALATDGWDRMDEAAKEVVETLITAVGYLRSLAGVAADNVDIIVTLTAAAAAYVAVQKLQVLWTARTTIATTAARVAQWLLNAAMAANPIGLVVAAVVLIIGALYRFRVQVMRAVAVWLELNAVIAAAIPGLDALARMLGLQGGLSGALRSAASGARSMATGMQASQDATEGAADAASGATVETDKLTGALDTNAGAAKGAAVAVDTFKGALVTAREEVTKLERELRDLESTDPLKLAEQLRRARELKERIDALREAAELLATPPAPTFMSTIRPGSGERVGQDGAREAAAADAEREAARGRLLAWQAEMQAKVRASLARARGEIEGEFVVTAEDVITTSWIGALSNFVDRYKETMEEVARFSADVLGGVGDLLSAQHEARMQQIDARAAREIAAHDAETARADAAEARAAREQQLAGAATEQERARLAQQFAAEDARAARAEQRARIEERYEAERRAEARKTAIMERRIALAQIAIQTALNVVRAFPSPFRMAAAAVLGALQAAAVHATPIPALNAGGIVPGSGPDRDSVLARLTPGEAVVTRRSVGPNADLIAAMNASPGRRVAGAGGLSRDDLDYLASRIAATVNGVKVVPVLRDRDAAAAARDGAREATITRGGAAY